MSRQLPKSPTLHLYECCVPELEWSHKEIPALSASKARYRFLLEIWDAWPEVEFRHVQVRSLGQIHAPQPNEAFARVIASRGVPFVHPKMTVKVDGKPGIIWGVNDSSNFNVLFTSGPYAGQIRNCHPHWRMRYFDRRGNEILDPVQLVEKGAAA